MKIRKKQYKVSTLRLDQARLLIATNDFFIKEAYKSLRTNVIFSLTDEKDSHVIMVTSSEPREGKSTIAANLAFSLAEAGKKTLIIDCDMRKPRIGRLMKIGNSNGLSSALFNLQHASSAITQIMDMPLFVMTAGSIPPNPSELLGSKRMKVLVESFRENFKYIILDTPPVNVVTDAAALSPLTDGTLLVVRSGVAERNSVLRVLDQLNRVNAKVLGVVLNGVQEQKKGYGNYNKKSYYKNAKGYSYGYGYESVDSDDIKVD